MMPTEKPSILDLNDDCLNHVFGFLSSTELLSLGIVNDRFASLIVGHLRAAVFNLHTFLKRYSLEDAKYILLKFGENISKIVLSPQLFPVYNDQSKPYLDLVIRYCRVIKEIHISNVNIRYINVDLFKYCRNTLQVLNTTQFLTEDQACLIVRLPKLKHINLCLSEITGNHLTTLKNLTHLELAGCRYLDPRCLERICENNRLKLLDIRYCTLLDTQSFHTIIATQSKCLEELAVSSVYPFADVTILTELSSLKSIRVSFYGSLSHNDILLRLVQNRKDTIECLKLDHRNYRSDTHSELYCILELSSLSKLELCGFSISGEYLLKLLESCKKLQSLLITPGLANEIVIEAKKRFENLNFKCNLSRA